VINIRPMTVEVDTVGLKTAIGILCLLSRYSVSQTARPTLIISKTVRPTLSPQTLEIGPELTLDYPLDNPYMYDLSQRS